MIGMHAGWGEGPTTNSYKLIHLSRRRLATHSDTRGILYYSILTQFLQLMTKSLLHIRFDHSLFMLYTHNNIQFWKQYGGYSFPTILSMQLTNTGPTLIVTDFISITVVEWSSVS